MLTYNIAEIDAIVNKGKQIDLATAMRKIEQHIKTKIDPAFSIEKFRQWYDGSDNKPFKCNNRVYYWSQND